MDWNLIIGAILAGGVILALIVAARRNMNHNYTIGSGMFKMSEGNLEKGKHVDPADYNYYNNKGIRE